MYTGTNIRIELDTGIDLTNSTSQKIRWRDPEGKTGEWDAVKEGEKIYYDTSTDDITISGIWRFQAVIITDGNVNKGEIVSQTINKPITIL